MVRRSGSAFPADVEGLRRGIDHWRRTRTRHSPMPSPLWDAAVSLARVHGLHPIARVLGLNYRSLKGRVVKRPRGRRAERTSRSFVELAPSVPFALPRSGGAVVELTNRGGDKLAIHLGGESDVDVVALASAFWSRRS